MTVKTREKPRRTVGRYEVLGPLGGTDPYAVFRAFDPESKKIVAVKLCDDADGDRRREFLVRAASASATAHLRSRSVSDAVRAANWAVTSPAAGTRFGRCATSTSSIS